MTRDEGVQLVAGERVAIEYLGERHEVEVVASSTADRWGELVTLRFPSGATVAKPYHEVTRATLA